MLTSSLLILSLILRPRRVQTQRLMIYISFLAMFCWTIPTSNASAVLVFISPARQSGTHGIYLNTSWSLATCDPAISPSFDLSSIPSLYPLLVCKSYPCQSEIWLYPVLAHNIGMGPDALTYAWGVYFDPYLCKK